jgi:hypothetical protein
VVNLARQMWDRREVDLLVWVSATSRDAIVAGYAQAAREVANVEDIRAESAAERFLAWLKYTKRRWLIVLDDLTTPGDLHHLWPPVIAGNGRTVVTTQRNDAALAGGRRQFIEVRQFTPADAYDFLAARLARQPGLAVGAQDLAAALGYLPIALAQATAYMLDRGLTCAQYRVRFARRRLEEVLPEERAFPDDQRAAIPAIWSLSVERANALKPAALARPALELASVLDANGIPVQAFLTAGAVGYLAVSRSAALAVSPDDAHDALYCLYRLSLVSLEAQVVRVHALVQRATRDRLPEDRLGEVIRAASDALLAVWPDPERRPDQALLFRTNAAAVASNDPGVLGRGGIHPLLIRAGRSLAESGDVTAAADYFRQLRDTADPELDPSHPDLLRIRHHLAYCTGQGGDPAAAAVDAAAVVADFDRALGRDHPESLIARMYLVRWCGQSGDPARAAQDLERLIPRLSRVLGDEDPNTLTARNDAAYLHGRAGDADGAMKAFTDLLAVRQRLLGADNPHTLTTRNDLAFWTGKAGHPADAAREFASMVGDFIRVFGPDHPHTLATRGSAAIFRCEAGDSAGAVAELEAVLADFLRVHGAEHPFTRRTEELLERARRLAGG